MNDENNENDVTKEIILKNFVRVQTNVTYSSGYNPVST